MDKEIPNPKMINPMTGSIDTLENWQADFRAAQKDNPALTWAEWGGDKLIEVDENHGMKITLHYRNPTPSHCDVAIFINGALTGVLTLRQEELGSFQQIIAHGLSLPADKFLATGNPDFPTPDTQLYHYYASTVWGWAVGLTLEEAIKKVSAILPRTIAKVAFPVLCRTCRVELPLRAEYDISNYLPKGVPTSDAKQVQILSRSGFFSVINNAGEI